MTTMATRTVQASRSGRPAGVRPTSSLGTRPLLRWGGVDWWLMAAVSGLLVLGTLLVWSATTTRDDLTGGDPRAYLYKQVTNIAIGLVLMSVVLVADHRWVRVAAPVAYLASVGGLVAVLVAVGSLWGVSKLTVENRFIDYFQEETEIYKGMVQIDRKLGGTTPMDIIIDAPKVEKSTFARQQPDQGWDGEALEDSASDPFADGGDPFAGSDPFASGNSAQDTDAFADNAPVDDPFAAGGDVSDPFAQQDSAQAQSLKDAYWFTPARLAQLVEIQDYLESLPETGKVLSLATTYEVAAKLNGGPLEYVQLMLLAKFIPTDLHQQLVKPYLSDDGNQVRISVRVIDSDKNLNRNALLAKIRHDLQNDFGLQPEQVHLTGAMVLYNNMLQSLFDSQIKTLGYVFAAILIMLLILFRSLPVALISMVPSLVSAALVLGLMGWIGLPLDLMTITITAITIGIAVDDTIHYIHRFHEELPNDNDYVATMKRCHGSIGKAMYYTSLTIIAGFSILALSSFNPTVYFGLLTGLAMLVALLSNLTLLPALLITVKPKLKAGY
mgnify:CR=1 FL=1